MNNKKVSICLCTYNGEKYISSLLESVIMQTIMPDEIIIMDDCSTDNTLEIIYNYAKLYPQLSWYINKQTQNVGWKVNFYKAINLARGDLIFLCDQDDIWVKNKIEIMINIIDSNGISLLACNVKPFYEDVNAKRISIKCKDDFSLEKVESDYQFMQCQRPGCSFCFKKALVDSFNSTWQPSFAHDHLLWMLAYIKDELYIINFIGVLFRRHSSNATATKSPFSPLSKTRKEYNYLYLMNNIQYLNKIKEFFDENDISLDKKNILLRNEYFCSLRKKLYEKRKFIYFLKLLKYIKFYHTKKTYILELLAIIYE